MDFFDYTDYNTLNEVYPNKGESKKDFLARFMSTMADEYPNSKQRFAVANSYWDRRKKHLKESVSKDDLDFLEECLFDLMEETIDYNNYYDKEITLVDGKYTVYTDLVNPRGDLMLRLGVVDEEEGTLIDDYSIFITPGEHSFSGEYAEDIKRACKAIAGIIEQWEKTHG